MKFRRLSALSTLAAGLLVGALAIACSGSSAEEPTPEAAASATATGTATRTPSLTPTPTITPSPTPTPFDGNVARLKVPRLGIDYPIELLGLTPAGDQLDTPHNATGAIGWYNTTHTYIANLEAKHGTPGFGGNSLFSAHVNWDFGNQDGPFKNLYQAVAGDQIVVEMAGGPAYTYEVFAVKRYAIDPRYTTSEVPEVVDMGAIIRGDGKPAGEEWVTLMTCSCDPGRFAGGECFDRDVIYAKRVK